jgi:hypothetical protein
MSQIAPLVPQEVDLRDFAYMPLDVVRLRDSDIAAIATGDGFRAAVMLWCAAWHQIPAASLPNDDRMLARLAGYGRDVKGWAEVKVDAMRGFVLCLDGRLYHPTVAEKACEAWDAKLKQRARTEAARLAKLTKHADTRHVEHVTCSVTESDDVSVTDSVTASKGREGKGEDSSSLRSEPISPLRSDIGKRVRDDFDQFWQAYPNKVGKPVALKSFERIAKHDFAYSLDEILEGLDRYKRSIGDKPWLNPSTFLNQRRWEDQPAAAQPRAGPPQKPKTVTYATMLAELKGYGQNDETSFNFNGKTIDADPVGNPPGPRFGKIALGN